MLELYWLTSTDIRLNDVMARVKYVIGGNRKSWAQRTTGVLAGSKDRAPEAKVSEVHSDE